MKQRYVLVVNAKRQVRVVKKPRLAADEVGVNIVIEFPDSWGKTIGTVDIVAPEFLPEVKYEQVEPG